MVPSSDLFTSKINHGCFSPIRRQLHKITNSERNTNTHKKKIIALYSSNTLKHTEIGKLWYLLAKTQHTHAHQKHCNLNLDEKKTGCQCFDALSCPILNGDYCLYSGTKGIPILTCFICLFHFYSFGYVCTKCIKPIKYTDDFRLNLSKSSNP